MTKVVARFRLQAPLDTAQLERLAEARGVYGILGFQMDDASQALAVEYDATRMNRQEVAGLLRRCGVAAVLE